MRSVYEDLTTSASCQSGHKSDASEQPKLRYPMQFSITTRTALIEGCSYSSAKDKTSVFKDLFSLA